MSLLHLARCLVGILAEVVRRKQVQHDWFSLVVGNLVGLLKLLDNAFGCRIVAAVEATNHITAYLTVA